MIKQIMDSIKPIKEVKLWNSGYCSLYDFSKANSSEEHRIAHVCHVANVCRGDKGVKNPEELYQQLLTEHGGKPGSVFEFVPVSSLFGDEPPLRITKFGIQTGVITNKLYDLEEWKYNLRSHLESKLPDKYTQPKFTKDFFVFKIKVPQMIVKHILRHRMLSFQEMSERTNKLREYYYCDEFKDWFNDYYDVLLRTVDYEPDFDTLWFEMIYGMNQEGFDIAQRDFKIRQELLNKGSHGLAYTTLWIAAWKQNAYAWDNFFAVRAKKPAQKEIIMLAEVIKQMMEESC